MLKNMTVFCWKSSPVRSMSALLLESISVNISWKWSLTAARTALWAEKERPLVRRVMSQKRPASRWLLSLLSTSVPWLAIIFVTHLLPFSCWKETTESHHCRDSCTQENPCLKEVRGEKDKLKCEKIRFKRAKTLGTKLAVSREQMSYLQFLPVLTLTPRTAEDKVSDLEVHSCWANSWANMTTKAISHTSTELHSKMT